jgi:AcrR family transcriptional regulator
MSSKETAGGSRMERKKEETKQKIIRAAMKLFKERGLDATTMEQIAEDVDIAKGTLYNYFPVKEAILDEYIQRSFRENSSERIQRLQEMPDTRSRSVFILCELMAGVQAQKDIFEKYFIYRIQQMIALRQDESARSGFSSLGTAVIALGQQSAEIRDDLPFDLLEALFEFVFIEVAQRFYKQPETFNARETIEQCVDLFMNGVQPRK